jgi:hypothetical protein
MCGLAWSQNEGYKVTSAACGVCGSRKVKWWPVMAGYPVPGDGLNSFGCCDGCRSEWDGVWERKGQEA